ncbi:LPS-assembly lipoprotein RlpB precursor (Rare lipoprotein B) [Marinobacterium lacunae]|uniref:LPS-assembly lipoprotein LptE n=1 Tax=Marinobacterium lacunae TaxID=1232683 RepID=A0A081G0W7_9GAMM|nr:LPS assembly lipoprotein LptE [Marinobacterium lacunae]KEA64422.1 LPS-assembly lipoprotein RlpB precursor (Rare lipoprotein B) [Marinobacterium lacunae]
MRKLCGSLMVLLTTVMLSACGFNLAGYYDVPEALRKVDLQIPEDRPSSIRPHLNNLLAVNGIEISSKANYRLEIINERMRRRTLTMTLSADAVEYELIGSVRFSVFDANDNPVIDNREVRAERVFNNDDNTTARDALEEQLRSGLQEQLAQQIVRQYLSLRHAL